MSNIETPTLKVVQGDTWELPLLFQNPDGSDMDISDYEILFELRRNKAKVYDQDDNEVDIDDTNSGDGELTITISSTGTTPLDNSSPYYFLVRFQETESIIKTQLIGELKIVEV